MKKNKLLLVLVTVFSTKVMCDVSDEGIMKALDELKAKRNLSAKTGRGDGTLTVSGSIAFSHTSKSYKEDGVNKDSGYLTGKPNHYQSVDPRLLLEYKDDKTWGTVELSFSSNLGLSGSKYNEHEKTNTTYGSSGAVGLKKAFFGFKPYDEDDTSVSVELGRQPSSGGFTSGVQFGSTLDGVLMKFSKTLEEDLGKIHLHVAGRTLNSPFNHYGYIAETGWSSIGGTGFSIKYSFNHFSKKGYTAQVKDATTDTVDTTKETEFKTQTEEFFRFNNSEVNVEYKFPEPLIGSETKITGGFVLNHAAKEEYRTVNGTETKYGKQNKAWYAGVAFGKAPTKADEWSLALKWEHVEDNSVAAFDNAALGAVVSKTGINNFRSQPNYQGVVLSGSYGLNENLTVSITGRVAKEAKKLDNKKRFRLITLGASYKF